jgi:hypothetical protein
MIYLDSFPFKSKIKLCQNDVTMLFLKKLRNFTRATPIEHVEFCLGWLSDIQQPNESKVRSSMLLSISDPDDEFKYVLKAAGGSESDRFYESSLSCLVEGNDGMDTHVTFFKKYSKSFKNVLINADEIVQELIKNETELELYNRHKIKCYLIIQYLREFIYKNPTKIPNEWVTIFINDNNYLFTTAMRDLYYKLSLEHSYYETYELYKSEYMIKDEETFNNIKIKHDIQYIKTLQFFTKIKDIYGIQIN